ncbi:Fe-S cluster assembly ATPase SufC [Patescibacteria group bacterium]|nr:Fe-S cluster assembly ATPase SufC [Patescibacteria group bacterium]
MKKAFSIKNLKLSVEKKNIVKGISLEIPEGEIHALMGPNGSGKSTLAQAAMGHPRYQIDSGSIKIDGKEISNLSPDERAHLGLFLSFQYPSEIPGVSLLNFLRTSYNQTKRTAENPISVSDFKKLAEEKLDLLQMDPDFLRRSINDGFSGGEKKRAEILQLLILDPEYAILDETDSGLDVDALRIVAEGINAIHSGSNTGILLITHYQRILEYITPDKVHIMVDGKIIKSGDAELARRIEKDGYKGIIKK